MSAGSVTVTRGHCLRGRHAVVSGCACAHCPSETLSFFPKGAHHGRCPDVTSTLLRDGKGKCYGKQYKIRFGVVPQGFPIAGAGGGEARRQRRRGSRRDGSVTQWAVEGTLGAFSQVPAWWLRPDGANPVVRGLHGGPCSGCCQLRPGELSGAGARPALSGSFGDLVEGSLYLWSGRSR